MVVVEYSVVEEYILLSKSTNTARWLKDAMFFWATLSPR